MIKFETLTSVIDDLNSLHGGLPGFEELAIHYEDKVEGSILKAKLQISTKESGIKLLSAGAEHLLSGDVNMSMVIGMNKERLSGLILRQAIYMAVFDIDGGIRTYPKLPANE